MAKLFSLLAVVCALAFGSSAQAAQAQQQPRKTSKSQNETKRVASGKVTRILSYKAISRLPAKKRAAYLKGLRRLVLEFTRKARAEGVPFASVPSSLLEQHPLLKYWRLIERMFPEAKAELVIQEIEQPRNGRISREEALQLRCYPFRPNRILGDCPQVWRYGTIYRCVDDMRGGKCSSGVYRIDNDQATLQRYQEDRARGWEDDDYDPNEGIERFRQYLVEHPTEESDLTIVAPGLPDANGQPTRARIIGPTDPIPADLLAAPGALDGGAPGVCEPEPLLCSSPANQQERRDAYRAYANEFNDQENKVCIYAGTISRYDGAPGYKKCIAPREFCVSHSGDGQSCATPLRCRRTEIICNPILFGTKGDGGAFCVAQNDVNATASCQAQSEGDATRKYEFFDDAVHGSEETWNQFADNFAKLCAPETGALKLNCSACKIMTVQLAKLNFEATGSCAADADSLKQGGGAIREKLRNRVAE